MRHPAKARTANAKPDEQRPIRLEHLEIREPRSAEACGHQKQGDDAAGAGQECCDPGCDQCDGFRSASAGLRLLARKGSGLLEGLFHA